MSGRDLFPWIVAGMVLAFIVFVVLAVLAAESDKKNCEASGGHQVTHISHGYTSDGKYITMNETECVGAR